MKFRQFIFVLFPVMLAILGIVGITTIFAEATAISSLDWLQVNTDGFGDPDNKSGIPISFKGDLYAATYNTTDGAQIFQYSGIPWTEVITDGFGNTNNFWISDFGIFSDTLYAGTQNEAEGTEIWRSEDGEYWEQVASAGFGDGSNRYIHDFGEFNDQFYAATMNNNGGQIWRSSNGSDWEDVTPDGGFGAGNIGVFSLAAFQGHLYAGIGGGDGSIWAASDGKDWSQVVSGGFGDPGNMTLGYDMGVFDNHLYVSTYNPTTGGEVWRYDGEGWAQNNADGFGNLNNSGVRSFLAVNGALYAGVRNGVEGGSVWVFKESTGWLQDSSYGYGDTGNISVLDLAVHEGSLYAGTQNDTGGEVWAKDLPPFLVGFIPDEAGIPDPYVWNTLAYSGVLRAEDQLGVVSTVYTPSENTDFEFIVQLQACVDEGNDLCISSSWIMLNATEISANLNPGTRFAIVDGHPNGPPSNLRGLLFNEKEAGYMAGTLGGLMTESDVLGGVGGPSYVPPVVDFIEGYRNGAQCVNENAIVLYDYLWVWDDPDLGAATAQDMMAQGADTIFAAAGLTGEGAVLTATQSGAWGIGVDTDWYFAVYDNGGVAGADKLLSSAMKKMDNAVFDTILDVYEGEFTSGTIVYDLAMDGVGLAPYHETDPSQAVENQIELIREGIINGSIDIHDPCRVPTYLPLILK